MTQPTTLDYFLSLTPEQMKEAVAAMPKEARISLVGDLCRKVDDIAKYFVRNADEIWEEHNGG